MTAPKAPTVRASPPRPGDQLTPRIGKVATRVLALHGYSRYDQLQAVAPANLLALHGIGPKAMRILEEELRVRGLGFASPAPATQATSRAAPRSPGARRPASPRLQHPAAATAPRSTAPPTLAQLQPKAQRHWARTDPVLHALSKANKLPAEQAIPGGDGFGALVASITHQQVSLAAGRSIHAKLLALAAPKDGRLTPEGVLRYTPEELRSAGLSRSKAAYILDLADRTARGDVGFERFPSMPDEAIIEELIAVKGIGTWTAKMFLMFHLQRPDVLAPEDLGLRLAVASAYGVPEPEAPVVMERMRAAWSPYCSVAARVLWLSRR